MTRSLASHVRRVKKAAAELGQVVAAIEVQPDGCLRVEFAPPPSVAQDALPAPRIVPDGKATRVRAA